MVREFEGWWPRMCVACLKNRLAGFPEIFVVDDQGFQEQEVDHVAEALVALTRAGRQRHAVEFLRDVESER
jgi:hypothetical protein